MNEESISAMNCIISDHAKVNWFVLIFIALVAVGELVFLTIGRA